MAALTRGISFRRQGSSGLSWSTDTWSFNEEGVLVRSMKEEVVMQQQQARFGAALSRIHDLHYLDEEEAPVVGAMAAIHPSSSSSTSLPTAICPSSPARLGRSKSVGSVPCSEASAPLRRAAWRRGRSGLRLVRWLKKVFTKSRPGA